MASALVSTRWLEDHLASPDVRIVDATYFLPHHERDPRAEFEQRHIPGAVFFDIDEIADDATDLPHMVPSAPKFSARVKKLGLGDGARIVCYDANNFCASARAWWMFRLFGARDVAVLDGGLEKWRAEGRPLEDLPRRPTERHFTPRQNNFLFRNLEQVRRNITTKEEQVVDARPEGRFYGREPEPRPNMRPGHIPGSLNLPHTAVLDADTNTMLSPQRLRPVFAEAGVAPATPVVSTCGSGVSAAVINLALYELGREDAAVYDGSWAEWGGRNDTPVETT